MERRTDLLGEDLKSIWMDTIDNPKTARPIGSGPFLVERWERGKQLTLVRNERYWGPHPSYLKRLAYRFGGVGGDPADVLRNGDVDIYWSGVGRQEDYRPIHGYRRHFWPGGNVELVQTRKLPKRNTNPHAPRGKYLKPGPGRSVSVGLLSHLAGGGARHESGRSDDLSSEMRNFRRPSGQV